MAIEAANAADLGLRENEILAVSFVGPRTMRRVNREFLGHDYITDVISFDYRTTGDTPPEEPETAIEILVSPDMAAENAEKHPERSYDSELLLYVVHGILHAAGFDDQTPKEKRKMRRAEKKIMEKILRA
jgi:probable rRNA maturation factor